MTALEENIVARPEDVRTNILHTIAVRLADLNTRVQLEVAIPTLEFLEDIEGKTADDVRKIKDQEKLIDLLESEGYRDRLQNEFTEKFNVLDTKFLRKYLEELEYEDAIAEVSLQLSSSLAQVQEELLYGVIKKPTLQ